MGMGEPASDRRAFFFALLLLVGLCAGMGVREWAGARRQAPIAVATGGGEVFRTRLSDDAAALWGDLLSALGAGAKRFSFEQLSALLSRHSKDPVARAFVTEFMSDPELQAAWDEFVRSETPSGAERLIRKLSQSSKFAKLMNRFAGDSRFFALVESLTADARSHQGGPAGGAQLAGVLPGFLGGPGPAAAPAVGAAQGVGPRPGAGPATAADAAGPGGPVRWNLGGEAIGPANGGAEGGGTKDDGGLTDQKAIVNEVKGKDTHEVSKLSLLKAAGPSEDLNPWASLCYRENTQISKAECSAINRHLGDDALWSACHKASLLDRCVTLCGNLPELRCADQAQSMRTCLEGGHAPERCAQACSASADCRLQQDQPPPPDDRPPPPEPEERKEFSSAELVGDLNSLWTNAEPASEADVRVYSGVLDLVRRAFDPAPDVYATFQARLRAIIQESPTCGDACERHQTEALIRQTFGSQIR